MLNNFLFVFLIALKKCSWFEIFDECNLKIHQTKLSELMYGEKQYCNLPSQFPFKSKSNITGIMMILIH